MAPEEGLDNREGTGHGTSLSLLKSVSKHETPGEDKPNANPDLLGTGNRTNPGLSSTRTPDFTSLDVNFSPGSHNSKDQPAQSTVGTQMSAAEVLSQQIGDMIQRLQTYAPVAPRIETLTTGDSSQAPPDYRAAVADYFESLAKAPSSPPPPSR